jgi:hypothetical protein
MQINMHLADGTLVHPEFTVFDAIGPHGALPSDGWMKYAPFHRFSAGESIYVSNIRHVYQWDGTGWVDLGRAYTPGEPRDPADRRSTAPPQQANHRTLSRPR